MRSNLTRKRIWTFGIRHVKHQGMPAARLLAAAGLLLKSDPHKDPPPIHPQAHQPQDEQHGHRLRDGTLRRV